MLHGDTGVGSREDTEMAGLAWLAWEDNPSPLHSHQKRFHLQIRFWLPPKAPARSLWINRSSFCCKDARKGALWMTGGDGRQSQMEMRACSHPSLTPTYPKSHYDQLNAENISGSHNAQQRTSVFLHWESLGEKQGMPLFLREQPSSMVKTRLAEKEVARELPERSGDEWEAHSFWESFWEL